MFSWLRGKITPSKQVPLAVRAAGFDSEREFLNAIAVAARARVDPTQARGFYETVCAVHGKTVVDIAGEMIRDGRWDVRFRNTTFDEAISMVADENPQSYEEIRKENEEFMKRRKR